MMSVCKAPQLSYPFEGVGEGLLKEKVAAGARRGQGYWHMLACGVADERRRWPQRKRLLQVFALGQPIAAKVLGQIAAPDPPRDHFNGA
jgi:hypothetical protein